LNLDLEVNEGGLVVAFEDSAEKMSAAEKAMDAYPVQETFNLDPGLKSNLD